MLLTVEPVSNSLPGLRKWAQEVDLDAGEYNSNGKYAVKGIGPNTWHYLCMLAGNENSVKPDVHITRFVEGVLGYKPSKSKIVRLLQKASDILGILPKQLDNSIWNYMGINKKQ